MNIKKIHCMVVASAIVWLGLPTYSGFAGDIVRNTSWGQWSASGSWVGGVVPGVNDTALFTSDVSALVGTRLIADATVGGLYFNYGGSGNYDFDSNSTSWIMTVGSGGIVTEGSSVGRAVAFANKLALGASQTWSVNGATLTHSSTQTLDLGNHALTVSNASIVHIASVVSGNGNIIFSGSGEKRLLNANTFNGGVTLNQGSLRVNHNSALGTGMLTINGGVIGTHDATARTIGNQVSLNNALTFSSLGALTLTGDIALNSEERTINQATASYVQTINGVISNGGMVKSGSGHLVLGGNNTYADGTTVLQGTLTGSADGAFGTGGMTVADGAKLILKSTDTIDDLASLVLGSTSSLELDFSGVETILTLSLDGGASWLEAGTYNVTDLAAFNESGAYTGMGSINVMMIPEPMTIGMLGLGALTMMAVRRMRMM